MHELVYRDGNREGGLKSFSKNANWFAEDWLVKMTVQTNSVTGKLTLV